MKYLIFNHKANLNYDDVIKQIKALKPYQNKLIIAPSAIYLNMFKEAGFTVCSQDVSVKSNGNFTGEITASQLSSLQVPYTLIGHYERQKYFKETIDDIKCKIKQALDNNLQIILCLGEQNKYELNSLYTFLKEIINLLPNNQKIILAYEPTYMISSQNTLDVDYINSVIQELKKIVTNQQVDIIYGGGVSVENFDLVKQINVDGYLIGNCSTKRDSILTLLNAFQHDSTKLDEHRHF